jgi:5-methylcytosine-specific restriction endonuclease McrA
MTFGALVDHKIPLTDGGELFPGPGGVWVLCVPCHGVKGALEQLARSTGQMEQLVRWCDEPKVRPRVF